MINFRFHLVSIIAVFLALALGILMGSTVVDQAIVDQLRSTIKHVREDINARDAENGTLKDDLRRVASYTDESAPFAVEGRLTAVPVALFAEEGVDGDVVKKTLELLRDAGADVPGVLWLRDAWTLEDGNSQAAIDELVGESADTNDQRRDAFADLAHHLAGDDPVQNSPQAPDDALTALIDAKFLELREGDEADLATLSSPAVRALVITGTNSDLATTSTTHDLSAALADADLETEIAEVFVDVDATDPPARGDAVAPVRGDKDLAAQVSTIDDLELVQGRVASVIALQNAADGTVGHYGYGNGAKRPFPEWPSS